MEPPKKPTIEISTQTPEQKAIEDIAIQLVLLEGKAVWDVDVERMTPAATEIFKLAQIPRADYSQLEARVLLRQRNAIFKFGEELAENVETHLAHHDLSDEAFETALTDWLEATQYLRNEIYRNSTKRG